jgi:2-hydroxychromene-2-carboxylate isomerase
MEATLKELVEKRKELKAVEKKYFDFESPKEYLKAHKLRKQTEKAIFKILENEK